MASTSPRDARTADLVRQLRRSILPTALTGTGTSAHVGGVPAATYDSDRNVLPRIPNLLTLVMALSLLLLLCQTNDAGFLGADVTGRTSSAGIWAAGNATDPRAQVITAAGAGSAAAIALNADLVAADVARAVERAHQNRRSAHLEVHDTVTSAPSMRP